MENCKAKIIADINCSIEVKTKLVNDDAVIVLMSDVIDCLTKILMQGNKIFFAGNGGSAADAQHLAAEFVSRLEFSRPGLPAIALSTDTSIITAIGNDYGFENLFSRQLEALVKPNDVFIGITTSGKSKNILKAFETCRQLGIKSVALCGFSGDLDDIADYVIRVPSAHTPRIQECHILIGHIICTEIEQRIFGETHNKDSKV